MILFAHLDEPPFNFRDENGYLTGCDVELARAVASAVGEDIGFAETDFAALLPGLGNGRWRMTTALFETDERRQVACFTRPVWALADGLLVRRGQRGQPSGYRSIARSADIKLAVVRAQVQHGSALACGVPESRISLFETYADAASAVVERRVHAFASVAKAHRGFIDRAGRADLDVVTVPTVERAPASGCFALARSDTALLRAVDDVLAAHLGSREHRATMKGFGFSDDEIDLVIT